MTFTVPIPAHSHEVIPIPIPMPTLRYHSHFLPIRMAVPINTYIFETREMYSLLTH